MRTIDAGVATALQQERLKARDFVWITARDRDDGSLHSLGLWSDVGNVDVPVIDALTRETVTRSFFGAGRLLSVGALSQTSDLTIRELKVGLSQIDETIALEVREYDVRLAPIQVYRGIFDPFSHRLINAAEPRFVGFVDQADIITPREGEDGSITLTCVSQLREMTRSNPDVRSDASQKSRSAGDTFYAYTQVVGGWEIWWGQERGVVKK